MSAGAPKPLAVTMGEPAGIGPDLILRLHQLRHELGLSPFIVFGSVELFRQRAQRLGMVTEVEPALPESAGDVFAHALPVTEVGGLVADRPGEPSQVSASAVIGAIERAVADTMTGQCSGIVTAPIHKHVLYGAGFKFPGHTEFLAALAGGEAPRLPVMMLCHAEFRVVPLTIHVPLSAVPAMVTGDLIVRTGKIVAHDLRTRFGIENPRIGVAGLNPHAGEGGTIGLEDADVVGPAVSALQFEGVDAVGPVPADTLFYPPHWRRYDAVIAMYHDQALIPIKTVAFEEAVNVTLGLPFVRTSPDHGTALDIAGTGKGSYKSLLAAMRLAERMTGAPIALEAASG